MELCGYLKLGRDGMERAIPGKSVLEATLGRDDGGSSQVMDRIFAILYLTDTLLLHGEIPGDDCVHAVRCHDYQ